MSPKAQYLLALGLWICFPDERNPPVATSRPELPDPAAQSGSSNPMIYEGVSARAWNATRRAESVPSALPPPQSIGTVTALPQSPEGVADQSVCQRQPNMSFTNIARVLHAPYHQPNFDASQGSESPALTPALLPLGVKPA